MNHQDDNIEQELDDFLNGQSEINKIYAERESLTAPAHLEFAVKQMARENISRDDLSRENLSREDRSETDKPGSSSGSSAASTIKSRKYFMPLTLAASVLIALTLTVVFFQAQQAPITIAQKPAKPIGAPSPDKTTSVNPEKNSNDDSTFEPASNVARQDEEPIVNNQLAQQRIAPAPQVNIANDVKKQKIEKREQLANKSELTRPKPANTKMDSTELAQPAPNEIPAHINELLQNTNASDQKLNGMPPEEVLKTWQKSQWVEQVEVLNKQGKRDLAERYVQAYPDYFPNDSIKYLLQP